MYSAVLAVCALSISCQATTDDKAAALSCVAVCTHSIIVPFDCTKKIISPFLKKVNIFFAYFERIKRISFIQTDDIYFESG